MSLQAESSPTLKSQKSNGFWKVIRMPSNGSLNVRIPFEVNGRLYLIANTLGTSGIASLGTFEIWYINKFFCWFRDFFFYFSGSRIINVGTDIKFHMELPRNAKLGEILSLRISGQNRGNIHIRRTFSIYSPSVKSFAFVSANGQTLVSETMKININF